MYILVGGVHDTLFKILNLVGCRVLPAVKFCQLQGTTVLHVTLAAGTGIYDCKGDGKLNSLPVFIADGCYCLVSSRFEQLVCLKIGIPPKFHRFIMVYSQFPIVEHGPFIDDSY